MSGNLRGVSADQDSRFKNKEKQLLKRMTFPPEFSTKVDMKKVQWEAMKPWIAKRLTELLGGLEDDVLIAYVYEQLEGQRSVDPRMLQINLTGFLEKNASLFTKELWTLLVSANNNPSGIPQQFLDEKAAELRAKEEERRRIQERLEAERRRQDERASERNSNREERSYRDRDRDGRRVRRDRSRSRSRSRSRDRRRRDDNRKDSYYRDKQRSNRSPRRERSHRDRDRDSEKGKERKRDRGNTSKSRSRSRS